MRFLTRSNHIICAGLNLDQPQSFLTDIPDRNQPPVNPLMEKLLTDLNDWNENRIAKNQLEERIKKSVSYEYYTFPPTPEKREQLYFSQFLMLGQPMLLDECLGTKLHKYVFIYQSDISIQKRESLPRSAKRKIEHESSSSRPVATYKEKNLEVYEEDYDVITTTVIVPNDISKPVFLIHAIESVSSNNVLLKKIPFNEFKKIHIENRKLIETTFQINIYKELLEDFLKINIIEKYDTYQTYDQSEHHINVFFNGNFQSFENSNYPFVLKEKFSEATASQKYHLDEQPLFSSETYKRLFLSLSKGFFPFKILIEQEAHVQAILHGVFNYYSDIKLKEIPENIELILTEFQTGAGSRIDMMIQGIGNTPQGLKEYIPVGIELKYGLLSDRQQVELRNQMELYNHGAAIKAITDSTKVIVMGVDFDNTSVDSTALFIITEPRNCGIVTHSSIAIGEQHPIRIFPVSNLNQAMAGMPDLAPIAGYVNVTLPPRRLKPDLSRPR